MKIAAAALVTAIAALSLGAQFIYRRPSSSSCTPNVADLNSSTVQTAISGASAGSTVCLPSGTGTWTAQVSASVAANVTIQGQTTCTGAASTISCADTTIIVDNYASSQPLLNLTTNATGTFRLTGMTIKGGTGSIKDSPAMIQIAGSSKSFRMDHNHINAQTYSPQVNSAMVRITGYQTGVIDHNDFDLHSIGNGPQVHMDSHTGGGSSQSEGDGSWAVATGLGGSDFIFIEDNSILSDDKFGAVDDCAHGGKYVFRYNITNGGSQTHPTGGSGVRARGCRAWELYGNTWDINPQGAGFENFNANFLSSGTGVIWGNTITANGYKHFITLNQMRRDNSTYSETATPDGWGYCGTSFNGTGSNWDGNTPSAVNGYPCIDQVGRGQGDLLTGNVPNVTNSGTGCTSSSACAWPRQALEPLYEWLNTGWSCSGCGGSFISAGSDFTQNTDYYLYNGNSSCNQGAGSCTAGVGSGTRAQRPSNCTTGVAWWSTDQGGNWSTSGGANDGTLDLCTGTNTWTNGYYTPYTYPHPLNTG